MTKYCHETIEIECYEVVSAPSIERDPFDPLVCYVMLVIKVEYSELVCHVLSIPDKPKSQECEEQPVEVTCSKHFFLNSL